MTLNFHHLRYFREVAHEGHLTRAAERLNVSQSALSSQIKALEDRLGHALFDRVGRSLELTEFGRIALDHADRIFSVGDELLAVVNRSSAARQPLRIGAQSTLSRNFQLRFIAPLLGRDDVDVVLSSGSTARLLDDLRALALDIVLATEPPPPGAGLIVRKLAEQPAALHGVPALIGDRDLTALLSRAPLVLPTDSAIRHGFDALVAERGLSPRIAASVDDMAMIRLLVREGAGIGLAPSVVFADELAAGRIVAAPVPLNIVEPFYAVTAPRTFPHPWIQPLVDADFNM